MKTLAELINRDAPGWPLVQSWISSASRHCDILEPASERRDDELVAVQVSTRSPMGAILYESAGIMIDQGWLRILGSGGHPRMKRSLASWNAGKMKGFYLVADDVIGGFFALNGGAFGPDGGNVYYLAPDTLQWFPCKMGYSQFLMWCLSPSLDKFYEGLRWTGFQNETGNLSGDSAFNFFPPLFAQGSPPSERHRAPVPVEEQFIFTMQSQSFVSGKGLNT
jgi:hypothetical protein